MVEGIQYGPVTPSVRMCHIISTEESVQYGTVALSVQWRVCSMDVQYRTTKSAKGLLVVVFSGKNDILQTDDVTVPYCTFSTVLMTCLFHTDGVIHPY